MLHRSVWRAERGSGEMALLRYSVTRDFWGKDHLHRFPFPVSITPGYRFEAFMAYLHINDPAQDSVNDKLRGQPGFDGL